MATDLLLLLYCEVEPNSLSGSELTLAIFLTYRTQWKRHSGNPMARLETPCWASWNALLGALSSGSSWELPSKNLLP